MQKKHSCWREVLRKMCGVVWCVWMASKIGESGEHLQISIAMENPQYDPLMFFNFSV
jgi:hypothetical protein